jgi:excisionase family DNA binding protein
MVGKKAARKRSGRAGKAVRKTAAKPARKTTRKPVKRTAKKRGAKKTASAGTGLLTLTEVSKRTGISMPTLQRYKKLYQRRLETVGKGRTQRYKVESLETFQEIKKENLKKRGRPRKKVAAVVAKPAPRSKTAPEGLISLSEIGRRTGISYPTLLRYVKLHARRIPSHGTGRKRRFPVEAVPVFSQLRQESRRGRRKGVPAKQKKVPPAAAGLDARMRRLEKGQVRLEKLMLRLIKALQRPLVRGI